mmetsp:Transcript_24365/g.36555  ORF Transcript_24365/g.36555 Transcript_24365/m.36555 type:complete len:153 (-) Transcript_24365:252-710(-)
MPSSARIHPFQRKHDEEKGKIDDGKNIITIGGKNYVQNYPNVVTIPSDIVTVNEGEFRFWVQNIVRRGRQITSLMSLGTFMCFLAAFFGFVDTKPGREWTLFVWTIFCLGIIAECSIFTISGCRLPREETVNKCVSDVTVLIIFLFIFLYLV